MCGMFFRSILLLLVLFVSQACAQAGNKDKDSYVFFFNRFGWIKMEVSGAKGHVEIVQGSKVDEEILLKSALTRVDGMQYKSTNGILFTLKKLKKSVINDGNRGINSGDWQLTISGDVKQFKKIKGRIPVTTIGDKKTYVYYGELRK